MPETFVDLRPGVRRAEAYRANVPDRGQTLPCQAVARFFQLAGDPQSPDLESSSPNLDVAYSIEGAGRIKVAYLPKESGGSIIYPRTV